MSSLGISFVYWIIVFSGQVRISRAGIDAPIHTLKKCVQEEGHDILCEDFIPEAEELISKWPAGPYVLPMTRRGCPESYMQGWREGYLSITWQMPQSLHLLTKNVNEDAKFVDLSRDLFSSADRHIHIPATPNNLKLSFCYKIRSNLSQDIGSWPDGNFSIYATEIGCPPEFKKHYSSMTLPNISRWDSGGYVPDFKVFNDGTNDVLQMQLCSRRSAFNTSGKDTNESIAAVENTLEFTSDSDTDISPYWTDFLLIKDDNISCPIFQNSIMTEETLYLGKNKHSDLQIIRVFETLCYYEINILSDDKESWLLEKRLKKAYSVYIASNSREDITHLALEVDKYRQWTSVDLGRTVVVSAIDMTSNIGYSGICFNEHFGCFISREKLDFLHTRSLLCPYVPVCRLYQKSLSLLFTRVMEGRYVTLSHAYMYFATLSINVFTERIRNDGTSSCNTDLGMNDLSVKDDQISASSSLQGFSHIKARPYHSGWCPQFNDEQPFIQIEFPVTMMVEGITVYNSRESGVALSIKMNNIVFFGQIALTLLLAEEFNKSFIYNKVLIIDSSKPDSYPQMFWFLKKVKAKLVKLVMQKEKALVVTCIRFEVHGCRPTEPFQAVKSFIRKRQILYHEVVAFTSEIYEINSILTSIDFPDRYQTNQAYQWIIRYPEFHFIKLVFTHIELNVPKGLSDDIISTCNDSLIISNDLENYKDSRKIDYRYNGVKYSLAIETKEIQIVLSFFTCSISLPTDLGKGFRAFATYENIPACFSLRSHMSWPEGLQERCLQSSMLITSMAYLGFQFVQTTEEWTIHVPMKRVNVQILEFYVPCKNDIYKSEFKIIDMGQEQSFCNIEKPPDSINSSFDTITIHLFKGIGPWFKRYVSFVGFRIIYTTIHDSDDRLTDYKYKFSKVRNVALDKPVLFSSGFDSNEKSLATDGLTFQETVAGSCFYTFSWSITEWWLVDLQQIYTLHYTVLYGVIGDHFTTVNSCPTTSLLTGLTPWYMQVAGIFCGSVHPSRTVHLDGIQARYVQVLLDCDLYGEPLTLCEVQVYGELGLGLRDTSLKEQFLPVAVDGEWGQWSAWTDICYCEGRRYRNRVCDNPKPLFEGNTCPGSSSSYQLCTPVSTDCEAYEEPTNQNICEDYKGLSSWSVWSTCSSECGHGLISRTRTCNRSERIESVRHCTRDVIESRPCVGNGSCLVCTNMFKKCYSIISRVTNWNHARLECWRRNMTLVSMLSLSEMRFIKHMLRERRYIDGPPSNYFDAEFYVHIGLSREMKSSYEVPIWENGFYATYFTAWKEHKPSSGNCTRMNFKLFSDDNTWESEDCKHKLAEYIMCEYRQQETCILPAKSISIYHDAGMEEIQEQIPASEYVGNKSITVSGKRCNETKCRYVDYMKYLACINVEGVWEECSVKLPAITNSSVVYSKYMGNLSASFTGKVCQRWDVEYPQVHNIHGNYFKGEGISDAANHCRDPGDTGYLWCFTTDPDTRWEPCLLNEYKAERTCIKNLRYTRKENKTITGKLCSRWDWQSLRNTDFPETDLADAQNYCRDPYNSGYNWCYVDTFGQRWEPCQIEETQTLKQKKNSNIVNITREVLSCDSERIIPQVFRCDGKFDCKDKSDESECLYSVHPMMKTDMESNKISNNTNTYESSFELSSLFKCKTQEWIYIIARCDGVIDCLDASDETGCYGDNVENRVCSKEQFQCADGDCINLSQVCNFRDDCIDGSDEYCEFEQCSPLNEYRCNNGPCIPLEQRCDSVQQCTDGSDELACDNCQPDVAFHCDIVRCIPIRFKCDHYLHCQDGTDEQSCDNEIYTSCQDVWEAGYRHSGNYMLDDLLVECQFGEATIDTVLHFDLKYIRDFFVYGYYQLYNIPATAEESSVNFAMFRKGNTSCVQQVKEMCVPTLENLMKLNDTTSPCFCGIVNYEIRLRSVEKYKSIEKCENIAEWNWTTVVFDKPVPKTTRTVIQQQTGFRKINVLERDYQLIAGPALCKQDYQTSENDFVCGINGKHIPANLQCIYDIDGSGYPVGCRDGSHLINCENFLCPRNTVKCPDSYCIPQRFLCDEVPQCPGGEDEETCGCNPSANEVLIIHDEESADGPNINRFARQFQTKTNVVRVLSYKASRPLQPYGVSNIFLEIRDTEMHHVPNIETMFECRYKIRADMLLESVHFTNSDIKGVILIQSSEISKEVVGQILEKVSIIGLGFRIYRVTQNTSFTAKANTKTLKVIDIHVKRWRILDGIGAEYFNELCNVTTKVHCANGYKCAWSKTCIPLEQVCDGVIQCVHGDDEVLCDFQCPHQCKCIGFISNCSATDFNLTMINTVPKTTRYLDFSSNKKLSTVLGESLLTFITLSVLNLSSCNIEIISRYAFERVKNLRSLDLSFNSLTTLSNYVFSSLKRLTILNLRGNFQLSIVDTHAFDGLFLIQDLDLANAKLYKISEDTFSGLTLKNLDLSNNKIEELENFAFRDLSVENLNFKGNNIKTFHTKIFTGLFGLKTILTPAFKFCCIRPNYVPEENCYPHKDEFSSCDDLMRHSVLQFLIWLIGIMALLGNLLTILYRLRYDRKRLKLGFGMFVTNLAVADFFMGLYLVIIAAADSAFRKRYIFVDDYWRHSVWCNLAGILSTLSSEASVLFLCLITLDRLLVIKFPFGGFKLSRDKTVACVSFTWLFSSVVAVFPVAYEGYFKNEFYSKSGVCIALPLTRDRPPGWAYSLTVFICLNFVTFLLVAVGQVSIFIEMRKSAGIATSVESARKRDLKVARNLLLVVATDFMCWFPIGVLGMLALNNHVISGEVYAWAAVFILPINSALNPILYTLSAVIGGKNFNPSVDEQSLKKITKETGEGVLRCLAVSRRFTARTTIPKFRLLSDITKEEVQITLNTILRIVTKLAQTIDVLHSYSLGIKSIDTTTVIIGIRNKKLTGAVKIKGEPFISYKPEDKTNNISQLGVILRHLIAMREKNTR